MLFRRNLSVPFCSDTSLSLQCLHLLCLPLFQPQKVGDSSCHVVHLHVNARRRAATSTFLVCPRFDTRRVENHFLPLVHPHFGTRRRETSSSPLVRICFNARRGEELSFCLFYPDFDT